ncbi:alpha/beta hydrolase [Rhodococcus erythropolis]|uniref:hypothetical protein n=1 Tax=Rhodococcus erythropolis TaxID=1833 RepID=UPI00382BFB66
MTAICESERWAAAGIDLLEQREDIDTTMVKMLVWSLGGYYGPSATAFEPRISSFEPRISFSVAWGGNYDGEKVQLRRLENRGDRPLRTTGNTCAGYGVPRIWTSSSRSSRRSHCAGSWTESKSYSSFPRRTRPADPLEYAHNLFDDLVNSPKRELKIFTDREGA